MEINGDNNSFQVGDLAVGEGRSILSVMLYDAPFVAKVAAFVKARETFTFWSFALFTRSCRLFRAKL